MHKYHREHSWAKQEDDAAVIGISEHAQDSLGKIVYVDLPEEGDELIAGQVFGEIESTKTTSDLIAPISGEVIVSNMDLEETPTLINDSPLEKGWITKIKPSDVNEFESLMDEAAYKATLEEE